MAVRDFVDANGVSWRVWPVTPEALQPRTAAEDYLGEYSEGWLCFESPSERRRLAGFPRNWETLSDRELSTLLNAAVPVPPRKTSHSTPPPDLPERKEPPNR
jgi:hypothetical protein